MERVGGFFFNKLIMGGGVELNPPACKRPDKGCTLIFIFLIVEGEGGEGMEFFFMVLSLEMWKEEGERG